MPGNKVAVTQFKKKDNGSGKEVQVSFQNQSDDLFYDFINFYSGKKNLDTELLDLAPGEVKNITLKASDLKGRLKISKDSFNSGVIFREGEDATEKQLVPSSNQKTGEKKTEKKKASRQNKASEQEKNIFDRAMEGEIEPPHLKEKLGREVPDLSETVKEMKEKTLETVEKEKKLSQSENSEEKNITENPGQGLEKGSEDELDVDENENNEHEGDEHRHEEVEKRSFLDSLMHPFTHPQPVERPEEQVEETTEEDEEASDDGEDEDVLVTEKNDYSTERVTTGALNLDNKMEGGFVKGTMNLITGKTGTGKTAFCSNYIWEGAKKGEPGVYVTTEEREEDILEDINSMFGWDFDSLAGQDKVRVLSIKPVFPSQNMDNISRIVRSYISDLLDQVNDAIEEIGAERVVIDSVSLVQMFIQDEYMSRVALSSLMNNLREAGVTAVLVGSIPETSEGLSKEGIIEYLVDTVILLEFVPVAEDYNRTLKIRKMRRTDHETDIFPFEVTADGLEIHEAYESL